MGTRIAPSSTSKDQRSSLFQAAISGLQQIQRSRQRTRKAMPVSKVQDTIVLPLMGASRILARPHVLRSAGHTIPFDIVIAPFLHSVACAIAGARTEHPLTSGDTPPFTGSWPVLREP
jgi:hypothetical protein